MEYPTYFDELWVIGIVVLFLVINYNLPLSQIYSNMLNWILFGYLVPLIWNLFHWVPLTRKGKFFNELLWGAGAAIVFIFLYNYLGSTTPMANVFAETAFGASESIGKIVFGLMIPIIESVFFFVIIPLWILWKTKEPLNDNYLTINKILTLLISAGLFVVFHATSKGLTNTVDLFATFLFGALSIGLLYYFKSALPLILAHIIVNSKSVGVLETLKGMSLFSSPYFILAVAFGIIYLFNQKRFKIPFIG